MPGQQLRPGRPARRPTIQDVADLAGVSRGTVSRVLNNSPKASPQARKAVEKAVRETGYRANPHARSLASGQSNALAVLLTQPQSELFEDPTFSLLLQGISAGLAGSEQALILLLASNDEERRRAVRFLDPSHVDGVIHISPHAGDPMLDALLAADVPVVVCGQPPAELGSSALRYVSVDDRGGAVTAVNHLRGRGAKRIGMIAGPVDATGSIERVAGFKEAMGGQFDASAVVHGDWGQEAGRRGLGQLLDAHPDLDAVFCASDRSAAGAYETARDRGLDIPDDLLVVGFDGHAIGLELTPHLSTIAQPIRTLGSTAVHMLTEWAAGNDPGHRIFPTELVVRSST